MAAGSPSVAVRDSRDACLVQSFGLRGSGDVAPSAPLAGHQGTLPDEIIGCRPSLPELITYWPADTQRHPGSDSYPPCPPIDLTGIGAVVWTGTLLNRYRT